MEMVAPTVAMEDRMRHNCFAAVLFTLYCCPVQGIVKGIQCVPSPFTHARLFPVLGGPMCLALTTALVATATT